MTQSIRNLKINRPLTDTKETCGQLLGSSLVQQVMSDRRYVLYVHINLIYRYDHINTKRFPFNNQDV